VTAVHLIAVACAVASYAFFAVTGVVLAVIDVRTHRLPDRWVLPGYGVAGVLLPVAATVGGDPGRLLPTVGGALGMFVFYLALRLLRPGAMGGGDVKLSGVVGAHLGFLGWDVVLVGALAGFVLGGLFAVVLLLRERAGARTALAFGPWMLAGAWCAILAAVLPTALASGGLS
jgi:leader peptidase (prepilin peptidase) / N-methyltransferase